MKSELQQKLLKKYSEFFQTDLKIYTGEKPMIEEIRELANQKEIILPIQFGFECDDGWYMLLDELMGEIKNHIENENRNRSNEFKSKFLAKLSYILRIKTSHKQKLLRKLGEWIYKKAPRGKFPPIYLNISQVKEKLGGLRFDYYGGDDTIFGMTRLAEKLSYKICENCGSTDKVTQTKGWIKTLCNKCLKNYKTIRTCTTCTKNNKDGTNSRSN